MASRFWLCVVKKKNNVFVMLSCDSGKYSLVLAVTPTPSWLKVSEAKGPWISPTDNKRNAALIIFI